MNICFPKFLSMDSDMIDYVCSEKHLSAYGFLISLRKPLMFEVDISDANWIK